MGTFSAALPSNPQLSERVLESSPDGILAFDTQGRFLFWNLVLERITGLGREQVLGRNAFELFPLLHQIGEERCFQAALAGETMVVRERPYRIAATGQRGFVETHYAPLRDASGGIMGGMAILREVTAEKRVHDQLRESENRFRTLFEEAPIPYHEIDREGVVRRVNRAECDLLGFEPEEMLNRPVWEFLAPELREISREAVRRKVRELERLVPFHRDYLCRDGRRLTLQVHDKLIRDSSGEITGIRTTLLDVTEQKRVERELRRARDELEARVRERTGELARANEALRAEVEERRQVQQRLALQWEVARILAEAGTFRQGAPGILQSIGETLDFDCGIWWAVDSASGLLACQEVWRSPEGPRIDAADLVPEAGLAGWVRATREPSWVADVRAEAEFPWGGFARKECRGGLVFPVLLAGEVSGVLAFFSRRVRPVNPDLLQAAALTGSQIGQFLERRRAEESLQQSEARFAAFMSNLPGVAFIKDLRGRYVYHNASYATALGRGPEELSGKTDEELFAPEMAAMYRENDRRVLASKAPLEVIEPNLQGGETHYWLLYKFPIPDREGRTAFLGGIGVDITDRRRLEEQLRQSQKMEAIGTLAGGVAHDFNNLLTIIGGFGRMILDQLGPQDPLRGKMEEVLNAADRAAVLTSQLLAFSRRQFARPRLLQLNPVISNLEKMLRRVIGEHIELRTQLSPDLGWVKADAGQVEQVIMNLAVNARDAMPAGGELQIETANVLFRPESAPADARAQAYARLTIRDTGIGMDARIKSRLFEPFFTTKPRGKGTGLGLSTVYGIVKQHGGEIQVESEPGAGTAFRVYFPIAEEGREAAPEHPAAAAAARGTETVLLAEDDPVVRELARDVLQANGYHVLVAAGGQEALRLAEQESGPIDLLLTDVIMPLMSGGELAEEIRRLRKDIRVVYMSGYTDDVLAYRGTLGPDVPLLPKPFAPEALARLVREELEKGRRSPPPGGEGLLP